MTRYAIVGAGGQLAFDLARTCPAPGALARLGHADLDLLDHARVRQVLGELRPEVVLNGAAYNQVDRAESTTNTAATGPAICLRRSSRWRGGATSR